MKKPLLYRFYIVIMALALFACTKEYSIENVKFHGNALYTLLDTAGNCTTDSVNGFYKVDSTLTDSNFVYINVKFISTGNYYFYTDTVNGMWFVDSGYAPVIGPAIIKLKGYGKPILPIQSTFLINQNGQGCGFTINSQPAYDYLPVTDASSWRYQYIPAIIKNGTRVDSFDVHVTLVPSLPPYNGKTYFQYATSLLDTFYFAKQSPGKYYEYGTLDFDYTFVFDMSPPFFEYLYLQSNQPVGTTWTTDSVNGVVYGALWGLTQLTGTARDVFTIVSVNQPYTTITGNTFQDVITVQRDIMFKAFGSTTFVKIMTGFAMYAKGIGLVDQSITLPNGTKENIPILRWNIK